MWFAWSVLIIYYKKLIKLEQTESFIKGYEIKKTKLNLYTFTDVTKL